MEEIEYKLKKKNTVIVANAIAKLVDLIRDKYESNPAQFHQFPEVKLLRQKCEDADPIVSITACQGIVTLVELGILPIATTLSGLVAALTSAMSYIGIINSIGSLLVLDMKAQIYDVKRYHCPFTLHVPQHPMLTLLKHRPDVWPDVLNQIEFLCKNNDEIISRNSIELLRPLMLYVLCDPSRSSFLSTTSRRQLWDLLIGIFDRSEVKSFLIEALSWFQMENEAECVASSQLLLKLFSASQSHGEVELCAALAPALASVTGKLVQAGHDPRSCLSALASSIPSEAVSTSLVLLAQYVAFCPTLYLRDYLHTCETLISKKSSNPIAAKMLTCALLRWLVYPSHLAGDALQIANDIVSQISETCAWHNHTGKLCTNKWLSSIKMFENDVNTAVQLCRLSEQWQSNPSFIVAWLKRISVAPPCVCNKLNLFLSALFVHDFDQDAVRQESLSLLLKAVERNTDTSSGVLTLVLYKLAEEQEPAIQLELLQILPSLAVQKENIALIVHTLETLKNKLALKSLIINMYVRLWKVECRCYPYLQKLLQEPVKDYDETWEVVVAKALAIKQICETRPAQYGAELVALLSEILNKCSGTKGSLPSSIAIEAIAALCSADIVEVTTTWRSLAPRLNRDKRPTVIKSLCKFFSIIPSLRSSGQDYENLVKEVVAKLWSYISSNDNVEVITAAFDALSKFDLSQLSLQTFPECYRRNLKLPSSYAKTPVDAARKPEDVLPYIPCECWGQLLQGVKSEALESAGHALREWLSAEILCFRGGVYMLPSGRGEPNTYSSLPHHCICRGVTDLVVTLSKQAELTNRERIVAAECLRILGYDYPKPLPPLNWSFLNDLINYGKDVKECALTVASKQAASSVSARKFLEGFIVNVDISMESKDDISSLFKNLTNLCRGIPPNVLKPFIEKSLHLALDNSVSNEGTENVESQIFFREMTSQIKEALKKEYIHDANRTMMSIVVESLLEKLNTESSIFSAYVACVTELPTKYLERMSSPSNWWEVTADKLRLALQIRSAMACRTDTEVPLVWLNECIDATSSLTGEHTTVLKTVASVMASCWDRDTNCSWTLELLGQIQNVVNKADTSNQQALVLLCDVFILTVNIMSGHDCFLQSLESVAVNRENRMQLFAPALPFLLSQEQWKPILPQIAEWLFYMINSPVVPKHYKSVFYQGLVSLHQTKYCKESSVWKRFINLKVANA